MARLGQAGFEQGCQWLGRFGFETVGQALAEFLGDPGAVSFQGERLGGAVEDDHGVDGDEDPVFAWSVSGRQFAGADVQQRANGEIATRLLGTRETRAMEAE